MVLIILRFRSVFAVYELMGACVIRKLCSNATQHNANTIQNGIGVVLIIFLFIGFGFSCL